MSGAYSTMRPLASAPVPWSGQEEPSPIADTGDADCPFVIRDAAGNEVLTIWECYGRNLQEHHRELGERIIAAVNAREGRLRFDEWRGSFDGRPSLWIRKLVRAFGCVVQLHKFVRADDPGCFHTHPACALRIILRGGYVEELGDGRKVTWRPGRIGIVRPSLEHRIDALLNGSESWSLWLRGPKVAKVGVRGCR